MKKSGFSGFPFKGFDENVAIIYTQSLEASAPLVKTIDASLNQFDIELKLLEKQNFPLAYELLTKQQNNFQDLSQGEIEKQQIQSINIIAQKWYLETVWPKLQHQLDQIEKQLVAFGQPAQLLFIEAIERKWEEAKGQHQLLPRRIKKENASSSSPEGVFRSLLNAQYYATINTFVDEIAKIPLPTVQPLSSKKSVSKLISECLKKSKEELSRYKQFPPQHLPFDLLGDIVFSSFAVAKLGLALKGGHPQEVASAFKNLPDLSLSSSIKDYVDSLPLKPASKKSIPKKNFKAKV